ncbi:MAG: hypothetical protein LBC98_10945 [Prevotellaceae bacterium]|jgi:hypothetical protein|nr:hypothetical protein [Prevotellaceae bacterium]
MKFKKIFLGFLIILAGASAMAQDNLTKTVQVTRAYDPIISDADKIDLSPEGYDTLLNFQGDFQYSIIKQNMRSGMALRPIPAAKISGKNYEDPQWLYARLSGGYPLRLFGDLYINNIKPENLSVGLFYNHRSIWTKVKTGDQDTPADETNHCGGIYLRKYWTPLSVGIEAGFSRRSLLFYGYNPTTAPNFIFNSDSLAQTYTSIYLAANLKSNNADIEDLRYQLDLMAEMYGDNGDSRFDRGRMFSQKENTLEAKGALTKAFAEGAHTAKFEFDGKAYLADLKYNHHYNNTVLFPEINRPQFGQLYRKLYGIYGTGRDSSNSRIIFNLRPSYTFASNRIKLQLGAKFTGYNRSEKFNAKIYPTVNFSFKAAEEFVPFASLDGGIEMNDYKSISSENPYILPGMNFVMKATDRSYNIRAGAKGNVNNALLYNVYGEYSLYKDMYFYRNTDPLTNPLENNFEATHDDVQQWKAGAEIKLKLGPVQAMLSGAYFVYTLDRLAAPYHRPSFIADFDLSVDVLKNLRINLSAHAQGESPYANSAPSLNVTHYNTTFIDLGLAAEYSFNRNVSAFLALNNILNQKYQNWRLYKVPGAGIMAGVSVKF